mmetsp:Transcript_39133/g.102027  ORF Transcript_39133/g.102027 Transcript_39133/m.102027 type:complete len:86 (+) Transcript_39133:85-342(+)
MASYSACSPEELWKSVVVKNTFLDVDVEPLYERRARASSTPPALRCQPDRFSKELPRHELDDAASTDGGETCSSGDASSSAGDLG